MAAMLFDHVDMRVGDLDAARTFYDPLMEALGFEVAEAGSYWVVYRHGMHDTPFLAITAEPSHKPNSVRIAFRARSRADVRRIADVARAAGAKAMEEPQLCSEYLPSYFAAFFEDLDGNKLEVVYYDPR